MALWRGIGGPINLRIQAMDDAPINPAHIGLLLTMAVAITIDTMRLTALAFVILGMTQECDLKSPLNPGVSLSAAFLALAGISGTVMGFLLWGWLGEQDRPAPVDPVRGHQLHCHVKLRRDA